MTTVDITNPSEVTSMLAHLDGYTEISAGERLKLEFLLRLTNRTAEQLPDVTKTMKVVVRSQRLPLLQAGQIWTQGDDRIADVVCLDRDISLNDMRYYESIPYDYHRNVCFDVGALVDLNTEVHGDDALREDTVLPHGTCVALTRRGNQSLRLLIDEESVAMPMHLIDGIDVVELSTPECGTMFPTVARSTGQSAIKRILPFPPPPPPATKAPKRRRSLRNM